MKTLEVHRLLAPAAPCAVVDVGASPIDGSPPYRGLLELGLCTVTGFEPQPEALAVLERRKGPRETYLGSAIADGRRRRLHVCRSSGMTSLLRPSKAAAEILTAFQVYGQIVREEDVETKRLDDVAEVGAIDLLKMDVQGAELDVLRHGSEKLRRAVVVHTEVAFFPLYEEQPLFADVDLELRRQGFAPHGFFPGIKTWWIAPFDTHTHTDTHANAKLAARPNQLLDGDVVYVRDLLRMHALDDEQLKRMALIAHDCYRSFDLALRCVDLLEKRGALATGAAAEYLRLLEAPG